MVIDHDDVRGERIPACLHDEALCVVRAFATEAILAGRRHLAPDAGIVGHVGELGLVTAFGVAGEGLDSLEITNVGARREAVLQPGALEMIVADIIRPALNRYAGSSRASGPSGPNTRARSIGTLTLPRVSPAPPPRSGGARSVALLRGSSSCPWKRALFWLPAQPWQALRPGRGWL